MTTEEYIVNVKSECKRLCLKIQRVMHSTEVKRSNQMYYLTDSLERKKVPRLT